MRCFSPLELDKLALKPVCIYIYSKLTDKPFIEKEPRGKWLALLRIKTWHMNKQPDSYNKKESLK